MTTEKIDSGREHMYEDETEGVKAGAAASGQLNENMADFRADAVPTVGQMRGTVNHIFLWLLLYNFVTLGAGVLIAEPLQDEEGYLTSIIVTAAGTLLLYLLNIKKHPVDPFVRSTGKMKGKDFAVFFGLLGITQLLTLALSLATDALGIDGTYIDLGGLSPALIIYAILVGPVAEELIYRGFVIGSGRSLGKIPAIALAAFAFGLMHGNLSQFVIGCLAGLVLGFVFAEYSIWWALLIHILNNGIGVLPLVCPGMLADIVVMIGYLIFTIFGVYAVIRLIKQRTEIKAWFADADNKGNEGVKRGIISSPWFIAFTVIYMATIILLMIFPDMLEAI